MPSNCKVLKYLVGPKVIFIKGGEVGKSDATPIIFYIMGIVWYNFGTILRGVAGITPSYFLALMKWSLLVLLLISL